MLSQKRQDRQDQLRCQDKQDLKFYPANPADVSSILLILFLCEKIGRGRAHGHVHESMGKPHTPKKSMNLVSLCSVVKSMDNIS